MTYNEEYLPPEWIDALLDRSRLARAFPAFAAVFRGRVRAEEGEAPDSAEVIERTWPGGARRDEPPKPRTYSGRT